MKKNYFFGLSALTAMMLITSCENEELMKQTQAGDLAQVSVRVTTPELGVGTRAFGDGAKEMHLHYAVYNVQKDGNGQEVLTFLDELTPATPPTFTGNTTVELQLVTGNTYKVICWADNAKAPYTLHWEDEDGNANPTMTIDYSNVTSNNEDYDAFYAWREIYVENTTSVHLDLERPFAQLNIGTDDIIEASKAGYTLKETQVTVPTYKTLNLWNGEVSDAVTATFSFADYPNYEKNDDIAPYGLKPANTEGYEKFPATGYEYMAMNYILRPNQKDLADVTLKFKSENELDAVKEYTYKDVPLRRNYRTNIYGQLITGNVDVKVTIDPIFDDAYNSELTVWDGKSITEPEIDAENQTISIYSSEQLAWLAASVNGTLPTGTKASVANSYAGWTINLESDIYLNNEHWTPIGKSEAFEGTFLGNNHSINNLKYYSEGEDYFVGLFGCLKNATVKNLVIKNVDIKLSGEDTWGHIGAVAGYVQGKSNLESINVKGLVKIEGEMTEEGSQRIGAVVGGNGAEADNNVTFTNITVNVEEDSYVKGNAHVGGIAGQLQYAVAFKNCTSNIDVFAHQFFAGGIIGNTANKTTFDNCKVSADISVLAGRKGNANDLYRVGGIAGGWQDIVSTTLLLTNCSYEGTLAGKDAAGVVANGFDCGGYVGRGYSATVGASVSVNGTVYTYQGNGVYLVNGVYEVSSCAGLQSILDNANISGDIKIAFICDIKGNATVVQKEGVNYVINGGGNKFDGTFYIHGQARYEGAETIKFENINFTTSKSGHYFIDSNSTASAERYAHNVTVENCSFAAEGEAVKSAAAMRIRQGFDITVVGGKATNMHSLLQAYGCTGVSIDGVTIEGGKNGISFGTSTDLALTNSNITTDGYGVRADGTTATLEVSATSITATQPVIVRKLTAGEYKLAIGENVTLNTETDYQIVFTNGSDDAEYVTPNGKFTLTGADDFTVYPVASASAFAAALNNPKLEVVSLDGKVESVGNAFEIKRSVILNMNNHELNAGSTATSYNYAIEAYGDYAVTINDAYLTRAGIYASDGADVVFNSGIITHKPERTSRYIFVAHSGSTITINDGTFTNDRAKNSFFWADGATIIVNGGNFGGVASNKKVVLTNGGQVIITGGTFNFDPSTWVAEGYEATKSGKIWTVTKK